MTDFSCVCSWTRLSEGRIRVTVPCCEPTPITLPCVSIVKLSNGASHTYGRKHNHWFFSSTAIVTLSVAYLRGGHSAMPPFGPTIKIFYRRLYIKKCVFAIFQQKLQNSTMFDVWWSCNVTTPRDGHQSWFLVSISLLSGVTFFALTHCCSTLEVTRLTAVLRVMVSVPCWTTEYSFSQGSWAGRTVCQTSFIAATSPMTKLW